MSTVESGHFWYSETQIRYLPKPLRSFRPNTAKLDNGELALYTEFRRGDLKPIPKCPVSWPDAYYVGYGVIYCADGQLWDQDSLGPIGSPSTFWPLAQSSEIPPKPPNDDDDDQ